MKIISEFYEAYTVRADELIERNRDKKAMLRQWDRGKTEGLEVRDIHAAESIISSPRIEALVYACKVAFTTMNNRTK